MFKHRFWLGILGVFLMIAISVPVTAGMPTERIKETTDKIIAIVSDPALKSPDKKVERKRLIRKAIDERFNWEEMSRRTLARYWRDRTEEEKKEFVELYGKLLERTYLDKVEGYSGEKVIYENERVDNNYGVVQVKIVTQQQTEIPTEYRLKRQGEDWLVYDISIEGVSLINNYRSQFNSIILRSSYGELIKKLKEKVAEN